MLPKPVVVSPSLEEFKILMDVEPWASGGLGSAGLMVALGDLKGLFQSK